MAESGDGALETDDDAAADDEKGAAGAAPNPRWLQLSPVEAEIDQSACPHRPAGARRPTRARTAFIRELPRIRGVRVQSRFAYAKPRKKNDKLTLDRPWSERVKNSHKEARRGCWAPKGLWASDWERAANHRRASGE